MQTTFRGGNMKVWALVLTLAFALPAFADYDRHPHPRPTPPPAPSCGLEGDWQIIQHRCSSGAPPWDRFVPGRDRFEVSFRDDSFRTYTQQGNCQRWSEGYYDVRGNLLRMTVTRSQANCGPADQGTFTYSLGEVTRNHFSIYIGPFGQGGVCPQGDVLENQFQRYY